MSHFQCYNETEYTKFTPMRGTVDTSINYYMYNGTILGPIHRQAVENSPSPAAAYFGVPRYKNPSVLEHSTFYAWLPGAELSAPDFHLVINSEKYHELVADNVSRIIFLHSHGAVTEYVFNFVRNSTKVAVINCEQCVKLDYRRWQYFCYCAVGTLSMLMMLTIMFFSIESSKHAANAKKL